MPEVQVKATLDFLYDCMMSVNYDSSEDRKEYITDTFNNEWYYLFEEEGHFILQPTQEK